MKCSHIVSWRRECKILQMTKLSCGRMIWLLAHPRPPSLSRQQVFSLSQSLSQPSSLLPVGTLVLKKIERGYSFQVYLQSYLTLIHLPPLMQISVYRRRLGLNPGLLQHATFALAFRRSITRIDLIHCIILCTGDPHYVPYTLLLIS